jgi:hypothetical protein
MAIKFNGDLDKIFGNIYKKFEEQITPSLIEAVESVCMDVVKEAKQLNTYTDRTGNLRSSIGYVIYSNGEKKKEQFTVVKGGDEGLKTGVEMANAAAQSWATAGIVAVIIAGMDYALAVESKGYDVITGPSKNLNALLQGKLQELKDIYK